MEISLQLDNSWGLANALLHLAEAWLDLGDPEPVLLLAERSLKPVADSGFRPLVAYGHLLAGLALLDMDEPRRAEASFSTGLEAAAGFPVRVLEEACLLALGAMRLMAGDVAGAVILALQTLSLRSEASPFCIAFRAWDVAALASGGRREEAKADRRPSTAPWADSRAGGGWSNRGEWCWRRPAGGRRSRSSGPGDLGASPAFRTFA